MLDLPVVKGGFSPIDIHFAGLMNRLCQRPSEEIYLAAALVSRATQEGNVCLDLRVVEGQAVLNPETGEAICICPGLDRWKKTLLKSQVVGRPGEFKPLILTGGSRLYLYRYWHYEQQLASMLVKKAGFFAPAFESELIAKVVKRVFPSELSQTDWQCLSAFIAATRRLCVISGGPGKGKTTTVTKILALLQELHKHSPLRIAICAPTGKAAARLQQAIRTGKDALNIPSDIKDLIPVEAMTIHRLLGPIRMKPHFVHNKNNPLPVDLVVVDESSMVDLALMAKLFEAIPPQAGVILVGDRDQLASVEAGAILGDVCEKEFADFFSPEIAREYSDITGNRIDPALLREHNPQLADCIVQLRKNYRFGEHSGIGALSSLVNSGEPAKALDILKSGQYGDIAWKLLPSPEALANALREVVIPGYSKYLEARDYLEMFEAFEQFRVLCALRLGPYGLENLNFLVEQLLYRAGLLAPKGGFYPGRPIIISRNDYTLGLYNGDVGIMVIHKDELKALFLSPDGQLRSIHPSRLPEHETTFVMTVHKSQGSEFDHVVFIMPDRPSPVLSRELIYTAVTRAKTEVQIWGNEEVFTQTVLTPTRRGSGLKELLWGAQEWSMP